VLENYFPILLFICVGLAVGAGPLLIGSILSPNKPDSEKNSPYECGFEAFEDARMKFDSDIILLLSSLFYLILK